MDHVTCCCRGLDTYMVDMWSMTTCLSVSVLWSLPSTSLHKLVSIVTVLCYVVMTTEE